MILPIEDRRAKVMAKKILLIDSETLVGLMVSKRLKRLGYSVMEPLVTGEKAVQLIDVLIPDLVIMDVLLSGEMGGLETAGIISQRYGIPIIFFTSYLDEKTIEKAWKIKPVAILDKFIPFSELKSAIDLVV